METKAVTISIEEYRYLLRCAERLALLEVGYRAKSFDELHIDNDLLRAVFDGDVPF